MAKRRCTKKTKAGKSCRAWPLAGTNRCISHSDRKTQESTGFGVNGGRPRKPRVVEVLREQVEAEIQDWLRPLYEAREATTAVVVGTGPKAHLEVVPDYRVRLQAAREVLDRIYGRPTTHAEVKGEFEHTTQTDFDRQVAELVKRVEANANGAKAPA
jgi:hypothetical protein